MTYDRFLLRHLQSVTLLALLASASAFASVDSERAAAGMQKLGIGEDFGRWAGGTVQWKYNPTGEATYHADDAAFVALLQQAMDEISDTAGVDFQYMGVDTNSVVLDFTDGVVTVGWQDLGTAAGVAGPATQCSPQDVIDIGYCEYIDGSVRFNNDVLNVNWDKGDSEASNNALLQVALHELLHLLGIGHSDVPISIMYADPYTNLHHLRADDIDVLRAMYGRPSSPAIAATYTPPSDIVGPVVRDTYIADNDDIQAEISSVNDGETSAAVGLTWEALPGAHPTVELVVTGPHGYYYNKRLDDRDCTADPGFFCIFFVSGVNMDTLRTFPGTWTFYVIVNGDLEATHTLDDQFTPPVTNEAPETDVAFDISHGEAPLTVNASVTSYGDSESNNVSATWHVPGTGEIDVAFGGSTGQDLRSFTFTQNGDYEIFVSVTDDAVRYGTPGSGNEAGQGFQNLYRKIIRVGPATRVAPVPDLNGNGSSEVAVLIEDAATGNNIVYVRDSESDALINTINFGSDPDFAMEAVDANNDGSMDIALLQTTGSGNVRVRIMNSLTSTIVNTIFYGINYSALDMAVVPDLDNNNFPEIAVLGVSGSNGVRVQARDAMNDTATSSTFYGSNAYPVDLAVIPDYIGGTDPAVVVQARVWATNQTRAQIKNPQTGALLRNVFLGRAYEPLGMIVTDDLSGDTIADLVQLSRRIDTGAVRLQSKASNNSATIATAFTGKNDLPVGFAAVGDINNNLSSDIAMLISNTSDTAQIKVWDGGTGSFIRNIFTGSAGTPLGVTVLADGPDPGAFEELAVLGDSAGTTRVQVKDSDTGATINVIDYP